MTHDIIGTARDDARTAMASDSERPFARAVTPAQADALMARGLILAGEDGGRRCAGDVGPEDVEVAVMVLEGGIPAGADAAAYGAALTDWMEGFLRGPKPAFAAG